GAALIDLDLPLAQRQPRFLRPPGGGQVFEQISWSPDGARLAGLLSTGNDTSSPLFALYNLATQAYERLDRHGTFVTWVHDSRRPLSLEPGALVLCARIPPSFAREILAPPPNSAFPHVSVTRDDRTLYLVRGTDEGDIWMLSEP